MSWFLDGLAILFMLVLGVAGFRRGFIEELGRLLGLIAGTLTAISNSAKLSVKINQYLPLDEWFGLFISFVLIFVGTLIVVRLLTKLVHIALLSKNNQLMNQSLGFVFGTLKGIFIVMVFVWTIAILPLYKWSAIIENNSKVAKMSNAYRITLVNFFNWEDPVALGESYLKQLTQP